MKKLMPFMAFFLSLPLVAGTPDFRNLSEDDLKDISEEFHANFVPTTVSGASNMGRLWGIEAGLVATKTKAPRIKEESQDNFSDLYNASLFARADVIYGLGAEISLLPFRFGDLEFKNYSFGVKWTLTEVFKVIPFNIKLKAFYNSANVKYSDSEPGNKFDVEYDHKGKGFNVTFSKKIVLVEPYVGIGYVDGSSDISANGSTTFYGATVQRGRDDKDIKSSGTHFFVGVAANLIAINLGLEYANIMGKNRISAKLGFGF